MSAPPVTGNVGKKVVVGSGVPATSGVGWAWTTAAGVWDTADVGRGVAISVADEVELGQKTYPRMARLTIVPLQNIHHHPGLNHILSADGETTHGPDIPFKS